ncbi:hypothetical protein FGL80_07725 [Leuconostoc lactis]|uniref:hypothetical protein n=1 Tax=Leuconostoc lactis TaxID=1246 RepID=UPI0011BB720B|nr:hypothetical protein [Leuconostoc lactis]QEA48085.1 hypothetical protein FGL80_07725 [Leuconostoc lactis]
MINTLLIIAIVFGLLWLFAAVLLITFVIRYMMRMNDRRKKFEKDFDKEFDKMSKRFNNF